MIKGANIEKNISRLKNYQLDFLKEIIDNFLNNNSIDVLEILEKYNVCKTCGSDDLVKNGSNGKVVRYKCCDCGKTQSLTSQTMLHGIRNLDKWVDFIYCMLSNEIPLSCKKMSQELKITKKTAHSWRHKFLSALNEVNPLMIENEVEMDEVYIPFCVKGRIGKEKYKNYRHQLESLNLNIKTKLRRKEIAMMDRNKNSDSPKHNSMFLCLHNRNGDFDFLPLKIQQKGAVTAELLENVMKEYGIDLKGKVAITDAGKPMAKVLKKYDDTTHLSFVSTAIKKGKLSDRKVHNNNINNVMSHFDKWSKNFWGYSTKYQWNYLKWFRYIKLFNKNVESIVSTSLEDSNSNHRFKNIFNSYEKFIFS